MVTFNLSDQEGLHLVDLFGCKIASLPITYLGLPLHFKKPSTID
jgi:hypothetical protein